MSRKTGIIDNALGFLSSGTGNLPTAGANPSKLDAFWQPGDECNRQQVDHNLWQSVLQKYLRTAQSGGINRFTYRDLKAQNDPALDHYIESLVRIDPRTLSRAEQKCYWINLYNALTIQLVVAHYPVSSITRLGKKPGSFGPWKDELLTIQGRALSLDHIEHQIIRPLFNDHRIHFAVNCASVGCPDLLPLAFTPDNIDALLDQAGRDFISTPRGLHFAGELLCLSSIFDWYEADFGPDLPAALRLLARYADDKTAARLLAYKGFARYHYDWALNDC